MKRSYGTFLRIICVCVFLVLPNCLFAYTASDCAAQYPNSQCLAWSISDTNTLNSCTCTACNVSGGYPDQVSAYGCSCNSCSCSKNPNSNYQSGSCTCVDTDVSGVKKADWSTCTITDTNTNLCTGARPGTSNPCLGENYTIDGNLYCAISGSTCSGDPYAASTIMVSKCCKDNTGYQSSGVCGGKCAIRGCKTNAEVNDARTACVCSKGYYGTPNGAGCTACSSLPSPTGIPTATATNGSAGQTSATSCYIPAGSSSDSTGSFSWTPACPYVS